MLRVCGKPLQARATFGFVATFRGTGSSRLAAEVIFDLGLGDAFL